MAVIKLTQLGGQFPSLLPRNLPDNGAQVAQNLDSNTTEFRPLKQDTTVFTQLGTAALTEANPKTLYRHDRTPSGTLNADDTTGWLASDEARNIVKTQLTNDALGRIYSTEAGGVTAPVVIDVNNTVRPLGIPAPTVKPALTYIEGYTFTQEQRDIEVAAVQQQAVDITLDVGVTRALVGLGEQVPATGWVRWSAFNPEPFAEKMVLRVFALDPTTGAVIDTYGSMPLAESSWIFDPALNGFMATTPLAPLPSWAAGHSKWWCVPLKGFAEAFDIDEAALSTALEDLPMPGTQGAQKLLTPAEADSFAARVADVADKDKPAVKTYIDDLIQKQTVVGDVFNRGGAAFMVQAVKDFYATTEVNSSIEDAKDAYALKMWRYFQMIGEATATPFYEA